jgi:hypothetical protein
MKTILIILTAITLQACVSQDNTDLEEIELQQKESISEVNELTVENLEEEYKEVDSTTIKQAQHKIDSLIKLMRVEKDDIENVTFYHDKTSKKYLNQNDFRAYVGVQGNFVWLRFVITYYASDWLFINKYTIKSDDKNFTVVENEYGEIKTDHQSDIWEWLDRAATDSDIEILRSVANCKEGKIRFHGDKYYDDKDITEKQKKAIRNVLALYDNLMIVN